MYAIARVTLAQADPVTQDPEAQHTMALEARHMRDPAVLAMRVLAVREMTG